jgi:hypothetical protein
LIHKDPPSMFVDFGCISATCILWYMEGWVSHEEHVNSLRVALFQIASCRASRWIVHRWTPSGYVRANRESIALVESAIWNPIKGQVLREVHRHAGRMSCLLISSCRRQFTHGGNNNTLLLYRHDLEEQSSGMSWQYFYEEK